MVMGMGGLEGFSLDIALSAEVAPMLLLLLLVVTLMASMPLLESEALLLFCSEELVPERSNSTSSTGENSLTLSNLVDGKPEVEETLNPEDPRFWRFIPNFPSVSIVACFGLVSKLS